MRIVAGAWRGRNLVAPTGDVTRPTADRVRQALFDQLQHAPWAGRATLEGAEVLDAFAGTGALGLEALSRGAARAHCIQTDRFALVALRANIAACKAGDQCSVMPGSALRPRAGVPCGLVFLDPPYGMGLVPQALAALRAAGWIADGALLVVETGRDEIVEEIGALLDERVHGAARIGVWRLAIGGGTDRSTS